MSTTGFAARPGTDVEPMCSTRSARSPSRRIRTVGDGYRLITDDASVDLIRFRELVVAADRAEESGQRAEAAGLLPAGVGQAAAAAYRELRRRQHHARLNEEPTSVALAQIEQQREAIVALWWQVFGH